MPGLRTSSATELLLRVRRDDSVPLHQQLEGELRDAIRSGRLAQDAVLPSSRALAAELGLSRGVVVEAYEQLVAEGYLLSRPGGATTVACKAVAMPAPTATTGDADPAIAFRYGRPDVSKFPRAAWLRSVRAALTAAPNDRLSYLDGRGMPELREALAGYLNRVRGTAAAPDRIVITSGFLQGFSLVARRLRDAGTSRIAVEDPSEDSPQAVLRSLGLEVVGVPVDESGIRVDVLARSGAGAVLVTPAHQFPTGAVLTPERRAALVAWAAEHDALVIEDDYDAEFRYDREPIGAIQGLAPARVVYAGSASKTLAPGIRIGWLLLPEELIDRVAQAKQDADRGTSAIDQLALADFLCRGEFDRHLRRLRPIYRSRRDALLLALARHTPALRPVGISAGLHVLTWLPSDMDEERVVAEARVRDLGVYGVSSYRITRNGTPGGLLFGYAGLAESMIERGVRLLAAAMEASMPVRRP
jgi:GntR family transcriptional regulator/MocR family aminotransferase